jgi:hypothetical protein
VNFPHLAKNARYGAPGFVAGRVPEFLYGLKPLAPTTNRAVFQFSSRL